MNGFNEIKKDISKIRIKSNVELPVDDFYGQKEIVYMTLERWMYEPVIGRYIASISDYIKLPDGRYKEIRKKSQPLDKSIVNNLFTAINNPITIGENYSDEMDDVLRKALLYFVQTDLLPNGKCARSSEPTDWGIDIITPPGD